MHYLYLSIAIIAEVISTSCLKATDEFTKLIPTVIVVFGYCISFYFLMLSQKVIPIGIAYAIWSGVGIVLVAISGFLFYRQYLDFPAILGITLIMLGVFIIHFFSISMAPDCNLPNVQH